MHVGLSNAPGTFYENDESRIEITYRTFSFLFLI